MADYSKYYEAREVVSRILEQDFIGPVTKDECLAEVPVQYYIMGKLYPQKDTVEALDLARNPLLENEIEPTTSFCCFSFLSAKMLYP